MWRNIVPKQKPCGGNTIVIYNVFSTSSILKKKPKKNHLKKNHIKKEKKSYRKTL
jgi:hypothetical protein